MQPAQQRRRWKCRTARTDRATLRLPGEAGPHAPAPALTQLTPPSGTHTQAASLHAAAAAAECGLSLCDPCGQASRRGGVPSAAPDQDAAPPLAIKTQRPGPALHTTRDVAPKPARDAGAARVGAAGPLIVLAPCMMRTGAAPYPRQMISEFMELSSKIDPALPVNATREVHHPTRGC